MPDMSKIRLKETEYWFKDKAARSRIGDLSDLTTQNKDSIVGAINELNGSYGESAVLYTEQNLTDEEQRQARDNIGVGVTIADTLIDLNLVVPVSEGDGEVLGTADGAILVEGGPEPPFIRTINGVKPDIDGNVKIEVQDNGNIVTSVNGMTGDVVVETGGASSWNDLTDNPFSPYTVHFQWNDEIEYSETVPGIEGLCTQFEKISDDAPDPDFFIGKSLEVLAKLEVDTWGSDTIESVDQITPDFYFVNSANSGSQDSGFYVCTSDSIDMEGITFTKGVWVPSEFTISTIPVVEARIVSAAVTLDESVIPDTIARKDDFYHHKKGEQIYNTIITTTKASESTTLASRDFNADFMSSLTLGNWYIVEFNGVEYMCKYSVNPYGSATLTRYYLGNMYMQHYCNWTDAGNKTEEEVVALLETLCLQDTGEPFSINSYGQIYTKRAGTHIVNIYEADIIQIDEQYIPNAFIHIDDLYDRDWILPVKTYYQWDDNVVYDEVVAAPEGQLFAGYAKISNDAPESSFFVGKYAYVTGYTGGVIKSDWTRIRSSDITAFDCYYSILNMFVVTADTVDVNGVTLTKGIWVEDGQDKSQSLYIMKMRFTDSNKIISDTVIPDTIARVGDIISAVNEIYIPDTIARSAVSHGLAVPNATGETVTADEFNALLDVLRNAGYLAV